jgi:hypothetical protein
MTVVFALHRHHGAGDRPEIVDNRPGAIRLPPGICPDVPSAIRLSWFQAWK